jgi:TolB-like protein/tetratricopeptide (TPR) repeat protein
MSPPLIRFGDCELDLSGYEIRRGGQRFPVEPQVFELLAFLVRNPGRLVTKDELIAEVWGGRIVSDSALSGQIKAARQAIGDDGEQQRFIRTVHGRGFRFIGEVQHAEPTQAAEPARAEERTLALPDKPSIAVLAFSNLSGDPEQEYFADGIVEDIITALSRIPWLFVIARNSSFTYKGKAVDVKQVGRELGVRYVLEGSVRKAGNRVRITGQLIDAATGAHVWADRFEGPLDDIFDLQDKITACVAGVIEPALRKAEIERVRRKPTESLDAYDLYLRALPLHMASRDANQEALRLLRRAIALDPSFATAYALAGECYVIQRTSGWVQPSDPSLAEGIRLARMAAALGQNDPEALALSALVLDNLAGEKQAALGLVERALTLSPSSAFAWTISGGTRSNLGETDLALAHLERAARLSPLDPLDWFRCLIIASLHLDAQRYEEASASADKALQGKPDYPPALRIKAAVCGHLGRLAEGQAWVERLLAIDPQMTTSSVRLYYSVIWPQPRLEAYLDGLRKAGLPE